MKEEREEKAPFPPKREDYKMARKNSSRSNIPRKKLFTE
jgi:hypothetical protein